MNYTIVPVWKQVTPELAQELCAFWSENKAIVDAEVAKRRAPQVVCIARDEAGAIQGVATAMLKVLPRLRQPMYYYRQYFTRAMRGRGQILAFFQHAKQVLQEYNGALATPESLGLLLEIENEKINAAYCHAHEPAFDVTFIGYSPRGQQLRVSYFERAKLMPPLPLQAPAVAGGGIRPANRQIHSIPRRGSGRA